MRENRLRLLNRIRATTLTVADFSKIEGCLSHITLITLGVADIAKATASTSLGFVKSKASQET